MTALNIFLLYYLANIAFVAYGIYRTAQGRNEKAALYLEQIRGISSVSGAAIIIGAFLITAPLAIPVRLLAIFEKE